MNTIRHLLLALAATFGLAITTAGPAVAGTRLNHCEPLSGR